MPGGFRPLRVVLVALAVGCSQHAIDLEGLSCADDGRCAQGWVCDPVQDVCVREGARGDPRAGGDAAGGDPWAGDPHGGDPGLGDPRFGDPGFGDPGFGDTGFGDPGFGDPGFGDPGFGDPGGGGDTFVCTSSAECGSAVCCNGDCVAAGAPCGDWYNTRWGFRRRVTLESDLVSGASHTDFPVLLAIDDVAMTAASQPGGADVIVTAADGLTVRACEVERFESSGEVILWVRVPQLSSSSETVLWVYYGGPLSSVVGPGSVWRADYEAVWHMNQDPGPGGSGEIRDSTLQRHATATASFGSSDLVDAPVGLGINFDGDGEDDFIESNAAIGLSDNDAWSVQAWVIPGNNPVDNGYGNGIAGWGAGGTSNGNFLYYNSSEESFEAGHYANDGQTAGDYPPDLPYMVFHTYDGTTSHIYVDGAVAMTRTPGPLSVDDTTVIIGKDPFMDQNQARYFVGVIDEVRVSSIARPVEWIETEHANQSDPSSFAVWDTAEALP